MAILSSSNPPHCSTPAILDQPVPLLKRRQFRISCPAKNSLHDILRENSGISLFVRPKYWSDQHAQLLGTRWEELPTCDTPRPTLVFGSPPSEGHLRPSRIITTLSDSLSQMLTPDTVLTHDNAVKTALATLWPEPFSKPDSICQFHLYFGGHVYKDAVSAQIVWNLPPSETKSSYSSQSPANRPMVCYIGKSWLASIRKKACRSARDQTSIPNKPMDRLQQLRAKLLVPSDSNQDAYFVSLFLAMAQKHFYPPPPQSLKRESAIGLNKDIPPRSDFQSVTLRIITHDTKTTEFIVYTGYVTKEFLWKFHDPFSATPGDDEAAVSGIKIEYARVPIWPILGLRERLGKALGHGIVGDFNTKEMETWETDDKNTKRKHDISMDNAQKRRLRRQRSDCQANIPGLLWRGADVQSALRSI